MVDLGSILVFFSKLSAGQVCQMTVLACSHSMYVMHFGIHGYSMAAATEQHVNGKFPFLLSSRFSCFQFPSTSCS